MQPGTLSESQQEYNSHLQGIANFYYKKLRKLVYHLYDKGYTSTQVGNLLGVSRSAMSLQYPRNKKEPK
jgi:hypothetical protein